MAIKYRARISNIDNQNILVEISSILYTGDVIDVIGTGASALKRIFNGGDKSIHDTHTIFQSCTFSVYSNNIDVDEIQQSNDKDWMMSVSINGLLKFRGFIIPDGVQKTLRGAGNVVTLNATCGLSLLEGNDFSISNQYLPIIVNGQTSQQRVALNYIRECLKDNSLPYQWSCSIINETKGGDFLAGQNVWGDGTILTDVMKYNTIDKYWLVDNFVKSGSCHIFQEDGKWNIIRYADVAGNDGGIIVNNIDDTLGAIVPALSYGTDINISLSGKQLLDDAYTVYSKSISKANVVYNPPVNKNIIPNGDFDTGDGFGGIFNWKLTNDNWSRRVDSYPSINGRSGLSALVGFNLLETQYKSKFTLQYDLAFDARTLYKEITLGFTIMPVKGFPLDENGVIKWQDKPLSIQVSYTGYRLGNLETFYLNEYGYWWNEKTATTGQKVEWSYSFGGILAKFLVNVNFIIGDIVAFIFVRDGSLEFYNVEFTENMSKDDGVEFLKSQIPNSAIGNSTIGLGKELIINNVTVDANNSVTTRKAKDFIENIYLLMDGGKLQDVIAYQFTGNAGASNIKMPKPEILSLTSGKLNISFGLNVGQEYVLDDVYVNIEDNQDRYELSTGSDNSKEDFEIGISSEFSGFHLSNYMRNYSDTFDKFNGGKTLTEIYGIDVLRFRNKPRKVYSGTFKVSDFSYLGLFEISGVKYLPLTVEHDMIGNQVKFNGIEAVYNDPSITIVHKGENDNNLNKI